MYLPSSHFTAYVCFLDGLDQAAGGDLFRGFSRWLAGGKDSSWVWSAWVERGVTGQDDGPGGESDMVRRLSDEVSADCVAALFEKLRVFLAENPS